MQLSKGRIELNGIYFGPDTGVDEVLGNPRFESYVNVDGSIIISTSENADVAEYTFYVEIVFKERRLSKIDLTPVNLRVKDPGYPDEEYQREKKKAADSFLRNNLGNPQEENEAILFYEFSWGNVTSVVFLSGRNEYSGGFIEITYI